MKPETKMLTYDERLKSIFVYNKKLSKEEKKLVDSVRFTGLCLSILFILSFIYSTFSLLSYILCTFQFNEYGTSYCFDDKPISLINGIITSFPKLIFNLAFNEFTKMLLMIILGLMTFIITFLSLIGILMIIISFITSITDLLSYDNKVKIL